MHDNERVKNLYFYLGQMTHQVWSGVSDCPCRYGFPAMISG